MLRTTFFFVKMPTALYRSRLLLRPKAAYNIYIAQAKRQKRGMLDTGRKIYFTMGALKGDKSKLFDIFSKLKEGWEVKLTLSYRLAPRPCNTNFSKIQ